MPRSDGQGAVALITGAAAGIGKATTRRLLVKGMRVIALIARPSWTDLTKTRFVGS